MTRRELAETIRDFFVQNDVDDDCGDLTYDLVDVLDEEYSIVDEEEDDIEEE